MTYVFEKPRMADVLGRHFQGRESEHFREEAAFGRYRTRTRSINAYGMSALTRSGHCAFAGAQSRIP